MNITYIHHSCFSVELDHVVLLFDYYKGQIPMFDSNKHIFVFASHKHHDHFDSKVFELTKNYPNITFILSNDIPRNDSYMDRSNMAKDVSQRIVYIGKNEKTSFFTEPNNSSLQVETLASTDEGVAFIITYQHKVIYHAGDLNWWSWRGESEEEYSTMTSRFVNEMNKLQGKQIDVAFVPLDPRQEDRFWWGFDHFMKNTHTKVVFPMHFWTDYTVIPRFKSMDEAKEYAANIMDIKEEGQTFVL